MSEFSQSVHFWRANADQIRVWSAASSILIRFVASNSRWSTALTYEEEDAEALARAAGDMALLWTYNDDLSLDLKFYRRNHELGSISFLWRGRSESSHASVPGAVVATLLEIGALSAAAHNEIADVARAVRVNEIRGRTVRDRVAALLDLPAFEWLSSATCLEQRIEDFREDFPDAEDLFD